MLTVNKLIPQGRGLAPVLIQRASHVRLNWETRARGRFDATDSRGRPLSVFLPRGTQLRGGDVLVAEDGSFIRVEAASEPVCIVSACEHHGSPADLLRAAYQLGRRQVPLEAEVGFLKLPRDPALAEMLRGQHLIVREAQEAFEPDGAAWGHASGHGHDHDHGHGHGHDHDHRHGHGHGHAHAHAHNHEGCGHGCGGHAGHAGHAGHPRDPSAQQS